MSIPLSYYLILSAVLFSIGMVGVMTRRNGLVLLMSIELMLNAANLTFITFSKYHQDVHGQVFAFFNIAVAAAEAAVGLAIIINIFRHFRSINVDEVSTLKG